MKHDPTCIGYICTCDNPETNPLAIKYDWVEALGRMVAYLEADRLLFENEYISPDDMRFLRSFNKKKD